jgi:hypothetical protein
MLDNVEFILLIMDNKWNFVLKHYNKTNNSQYECSECSALALNTKFHNLCHGPPTESGFT